MNTNSGVNEPRFDRTRVSTTLASDTRHLESTKANQRQYDAQHNPSSSHCLCATCHLKMAHFPRRHDGRILLPPPVPFRKGGNARSVSTPYTQSDQLGGSEHCSLVDGNGNGSMPRTTSAAGIGPGKGRCSPTPQFTRDIPNERDKARRKTSRPSGSTVRSHATEPYPSSVQPKPQRYGGIKQGEDPQSSAERPSGSNTAIQLAAPSDTPRFHERQPFSHSLELLPQPATSSRQARLNVPSEASLERYGPVLHTTSRTAVSSCHDEFLPPGPTIGSGSRDEAGAAMSAPLSPPTERPSSRFFRYRPELFDQYVEGHCDAEGSESAAAPRKAEPMPEPSASQGARSPQPLSHIAHFKGLDAVSERIDIGALSFQKATTPPKQPATTKAASSSSRPKRNRSPDRDASSSSVQVKWDSERKRRQGYFAQDDGNEKSPFRHYNQTSCNFDP